MNQKQRSQEKGRSFSEEKLKKNFFLEILLFPLLFRIFQKLEKNFRVSKNKF